MIYQKAEKIEKINHLYFHVPFCRKKCFYCDFYSETVNNSIYKTYTHKLLEELNLYYPFLSANLKSIYFGGGTPYLLGIKKLNLIIKKLEKIISNKTEISIELNPYNFIKNKKLINTLSSIGFNRFSIGLQTFDKNLAESIKRILPNNFIKILEAYSDFNINLDFMFGISKQSINILKNDLAIIKSLKPKHLSYYLFTVDKNIKTPIISTQEKMYKLITSSLSSTYINYEVSNFSLSKKYFCKHNLAYWNRKTYLGLGAAAHSFVKFNKKDLRYNNVCSYKDYIKDFKNINMLETLSKKQILNEKIFLNLRLLKKGLNIKLIDKKIKAYKQFLDIENNKAFIKKDKIFLIDEITKHLISD